MGQDLIAQTKGGLSYGGITTIDVNTQNEKMIVSN